MERSHLAQLSVLATVARLRSFRAAARELAIAPSAVSHAVAALEERLGVRLLARTTRSVAATEEGARLLERLLPALSEIDLALEAAVESRGRAAGNLRVTAPRTGALLALSSRLAAFAKAYPEIALDVVIDDRLMDVVEGGFDAGIRLGESLQSDMIAAPITPRMRFALVAAPAFLATLKTPVRHPNDLLKHPCLRFRFSSGKIYRWEFEKNGQSIELAVDGPLILDDDRLILQSAIEGAGFAFSFEGFAETAIKDGRLVQLLEDWCPTFDGFHIYYPSRRQMRPVLRAFIDFFRWHEPPQSMPGG